MVGRRGFRPNKVHKSFRMNSTANDANANACCQPGDRLPLVNVARPGMRIRQSVQQPFIDFASDNLWYFWMLSKKCYDSIGRNWTYQDWFHWTRGVGCISMLPGEDFQDECHIPDCPCRRNGPTVDGATDDLEVDAPESSAIIGSSGV